MTISKESNGDKQPGGTMERIDTLLRGEVMEDPPEGALDPDENLFEKGYISSLEILELVESIEKAFDVSIPHYDVSPENFETLRRMTAYVDERLACS